jgi:hypothetical protein
MTALIAANAPVALGLGIALMFSALFFLVAADSRRPEPPVRNRDDFGTAGENFEWLGGPTSEWLGI